jgi:hemerythrin-like metal-binding protein
MGLTRWNDELTLGIASIDDEHMGLFVLLDTLHDAIKIARGREVTGRAITDLLSNLEAHFTREETLMDSQGYPGLPGHHAEHARVRKRLLDFRRRFEQGRPDAARQFLNLLAQWLPQHIRTMDREYREAARKTGPPPHSLVM